MKVLLVALVTLYCSVIVHTLELQCYHSEGCPDGQKICVKTCSQAGASCEAIYSVSTDGRVDIRFMGCVEEGNPFCNNTRCNPHILATIGLHSCCCSHDLCNSIDGLSGVPDHTAAMPPTPSVTPPPLLEDQLVCEMYNCSRGEPCFHGYQVCRQSCTTTYRADDRGNYDLYELGCGRGLDAECDSSTCLLNTSTGAREISCCCRGHLCNGLRNRNYTSTANVVAFFDHECDALQCSHACMHPFGSTTPRCLCRDGFVLAPDGVNCLDLNECTTGRHDCAEVCRNTEGSFECECSSPFHYLAPNGRTCIESRLTCPTVFNRSADDIEGMRLQSCDRHEEFTGSPQACFVLIRARDSRPLITSCFSRTSACRPDRCVLEPLTTGLLRCCCYTTGCMNNIEFLDITTGPTTPITTLPATTDESTDITITFEGTTPSRPTVVASNNLAAAAGAGVAIPVILVLGAVLIITMIYCLWKRHRSKSQLSVAYTMEYGSTEGSAEDAQNAMMASIVVDPSPIDGGKFGSVYTGTASYPTRQRVAIKKFKPGAIESWRAEKTIYAILTPHCNPFVLLFKGAYKTPNEELWIVTQYHQKGSLSTVLKNQVLSVDEMKQLVFTLVKGLYFIHTEGVVHRDLKSRNVLVTDSMQSVISDFGLALYKPATESDATAMGQVGTPRYMAPELIESSIHLSDDAYRRIDIYALGIVLWETLSRTKPNQISIDCIKPYSAPFDEYISGRSAPTTETMAELFKQNHNCRPTIPSYLKPLEEFDIFRRTIEESWAYEADCRPTTTCILERLQPLQPDNGDSGNSTASTRDLIEEKPPQPQANHSYSIYPRQETTI